MQKKFVKVKQGDLIMYLVSLNVTELIDNTVVEYFDSNTGDGYQRPLFPNHYRKIAKYFQEGNDPVLPPAIITAVNPKQVIENDNLTIEGALRIVDGQHRVAGIKHLRSIDQATFESIKDYEFPVIIMVISSEMEKGDYEISTFININKLGKKVSTDLAVQLKERLRENALFRDFGNNKENIESVSTKVATILSNREGSIWYNAIRMGDDNTTAKPISINAFSRSLLGISEYYLKLQTGRINEERLRLVSLEIVDLLDAAWEIVAERWNWCFYKFSPYNNWREYNIQKGIGVFSLHIILCETLEKNRGHIKNTLYEFKQIICNSQVENNDWIIGGPLSPFNSQSGFKQITKYIKNENQLTRY